jgi:hypothetical protein
MRVWESCYKNWELEAMIEEEGKKIVEGKY